MPRMIRFDVPEFMEACRIAAGDGGGVQAVADLLGITVQQVWNRRHQLKKKGIALPGMSRRAARTAVIQRPVRGVLEYTPLTFTIDVGCGQ